MRLLKLLFVLFSFLFATNNLTAQQNHDGHREKIKPQNKQHQGPHGPRKNQQKLMQLLNLSAEQKQKMKAVREDQMKQMDLLETQQKITVKEYNDRKTAILTEMRAKREAILTPEQKGKLAAAKMVREEKKEASFTKKMAKMTQSLGLTETQVAAFKQLHENNKIAAEKIKNDSKLNLQEKKMRMKALNTAAKESKLKILTEEQIKKMEELKLKRKARG
jgi:Spy/CpxP family protein refolding chaperone